MDLFQNEQTALSRAYLLILETHPKIYPRKKLDYQEIKKNIEHLDFVEVEKSGTVICFASKKALMDLNLD